MQVVHEEIQHILAVGETCRYLLRKSKKDVSFGYGTALAVSRNGQYVLFVVKRKSSALNKFGYVCAHLFVAFVPVCSVRRKPSIYGINVLMRNAVHGNIRNRYLVGIVYLLAVQRRCGRINSALNAARYGHIQDFTRFNEFFCARGRVMIHDARGFKPVYPSHIKRFGRGVRRKRVNCMNMVVYILRFRRSGKNAVLVKFLDFAKRFQTLFFRFRIESFDKFGLFIHYKTSPYLSITCPPVTGMA